MDNWAVRAIARTGPLAVDNASRCPPRGPLPTCPQPPTTPIKITSGSTQLPSFGRYKAPVRLATSLFGPTRHWGDVPLAVERVAVTAPGW